MTKTREFCPQWASAPGETIIDILAERGLSVSDFSQRIGYSSDDTNSILHGRATITIALARQLQAVLGGSVEYWMARDFQYRNDVAQLKATDEDWIAKLPLSDMIKFKWLDPTPLPSDEVTACLDFFGVRSVKEWKNKYSQLHKLVAFRTSPTLDSEPAAVAAWLRRGEIEAEALECDEWNPEKFQDAIFAIRCLTREKQPSVFIPKLQSRCADCGVAVAVVRAPNGCRASGATCFLSKTKALLLLSFRYLTDDHFWFSFFHEAGHLLLHSKKGLILESSDVVPTKEEREANQFAQDILIPEQHLSDLLNLSLNGREVIRFAHHVGVSPGIVVGQLQYHGKIRHNQLNNLKRRFTWGSD